MTFDKRLHPQDTATGQFTERTFASAVITLDTPTNANPSDLIEQAMDEATTAERLAEIAALDNWLTDSWIARHPNLSEDTQLELLDRDELAARARVAANTNATPAALAYALGDSSTDVRAPAAANGNLSPADQVRAAHDPELPVQAALFRNPNLCDEARAALALSPYDYIHEQLKTRQVA